MAWNKINNKIDNPRDEDLQRRIESDLIEIPDHVKIRCSECKYLNPDSYCRKIKQAIKAPEQECCKYWDNSEAVRSNTQGKKNG